MTGVQTCALPISWPDLGNYLRLNTALPTPGNINSQLTKISFERLLAFDTAGIANGVGGGFVAVEHAQTSRHHSGVMMSFAEITWGFYKLP